MNSLESLNALTEEELQVRVSEIDGWHSIVKSGRLDGQIVGRNPKIAESLILDRKGIEPPDYPNDLNAVHKVENERIIPNRRWDNYTAILEEVLISHGRHSRFKVNATARQRCIALLLTLSK